jgi:pimeloyl-ACP methyl ester carboxylesterase
VPTRPGEQVRVNGHWMYIECAGRGTPAVILDAGAGGDTSSWLVVFPVVARFTRVCAYDRASEGLSDPVPGPRTAADQVDDLRVLLKGARIGRPYVLAGHSWGGLLARLFATKHRADVAGLVLVDAPWPTEYGESVAALRSSAEGRSFLRSQHGTPFVSFESLDVGKSLTLAREAGDLGDTRIVVLSVLQAPSGVPRRVATVLRDVHLRLQDALARLSTDSVHVGAPYTDHPSFLSALGQPELVVSAIRGVVTAARRDTRLEPCRQIFAGRKARCRS